MPSWEEEIERLKKKRPDIFTASGLPSPGTAILQRGTGEAIVSTGLDSINGVSSQEPTLDKAMAGDSGSLKAFRKGVNRTSFLDKIGKKFLGEDKKGMTWQEKTGMGYLNAEKERRFLFRDFLKKASKAKYRTQAMRFAKLAEIMGGEIQSRRKAKVDIATGLVGAEATGTRADAAAASSLATQEFRKAQLGISAAGQQSLEKSRLDTAKYHKGMLEVAEAPKPGLEKSQLEKLTLQMQKDLSDVTQKEGAPAEETYWGMGGPNEAQKQSEAIRKSYAPEINRLKGNMLFIDAQKSYASKNPGKTLTRERWNAFLKTPEGKKYLREQGLGE